MEDKIKQQIRKKIITKVIQEYKPATKIPEIRKATFIGATWSSTNNKLNRWECPYCKENKNSEKRFNLDHLKINRNWQCRFCKNTLLLEK